MKVTMRLTNGHVLDVFNQKFIDQDVWILDDQIYAVGDQDGLEADVTVDLAGQYLVPGLIDAHMHVESTLLSPTEFGKLVVKHGITTVFADPHEVANVKGTDGLDYMLADGDNSPIDIHWMLPSSVPSVSFEHSGAVLKAADLKPYLADPRVGGLAEVMDFPAVKNGDPDMLQKIADTLAAGKQVDGHTSGLSKSDLDVYRRYGIATDHESLTVQEATDRVEAGFYVYLREGTVERDLAGTIGAVNDANWHRFALCTDDKTVASIVDEGGVDFTLKKAMTLGMVPERAYTMCTYNAAKSHLINDLGAIVPGFKADLVVVSDLQEVDVQRVMKNGTWVDQVEDLQTTPWPYQTMNYRLETLDRPLAGGRAHVIGIRPNHIDTEHLVLDVPVDERGMFVPDAAQDLAKIVNVERHRALGSYVGILQGLKLSRGAVAISVGHDSHNLLAVGMDDASIRTAIDAIGQVGGGYAVVDPENGQTTVLPLEIAGLMSNKPFLEVADQYRRITAAFKGISSVEFDPFLTLAFLSLPVIPSLKITDQGLFDYEVFDFIDINA